MEERGTQAIEWMSRWGFATLVCVGAIAAASIAWRVNVPAVVPSFALQAAPIYRLEVGAAIFVGIYIGSIALVLALNNRAFAEIGASGLKAADIGTAKNQAIDDLEGKLEALTWVVDDLRRDFKRDDGGIE